MSEKIDVVYTWVNGDDPVWREKRKKALQNKKYSQDIELYGNVEGRFRDNGELKYALRSLEKYFPEHGDIYIITDEQIPSFLNLDPCIKILFHKDFMKAGSFPTFSSKNIIAQIPYISSLSERFLLCNDDIFFGPRFHITDFFTDTSKYYFRDPHREDSLSQGAHGNSGECVLAEKYSDYIPSYSVVAHTPKAVVKTDFFECMKIFENIYENVVQEVFRNVKNPGIVGDLYSRWMLYTKRGQRGEKSDFYVQSDAENYEALYNNFENLSFFCINDTGDDKEKSDSSLRKIAEVLEELFPHPSRFEK